MRKVIISLAPVRSGDPVDAESLAEDVAACVKAGAGMCHLHCRLADGSLSPDTSYLKKQFEEIGKRCDVVWQASTGGVSDMTIEERCHPLDIPGVESSSLNAGSTNLNGAVYINTWEQIDYCAKASWERGIIPEVEVFDIGMLYNIERSAQRVPYHRPIFYNLVFGHKGGMQADMKCLTAFISAVPQNAVWGVTHYGRDNWEFLAAAIAMGAADVRIGFEDSNYLAPGKTAVKNAELVERLVQLIRAEGLEPATPDETRRIMNLKRGH
ncbi:MAG: 3-keto-5-aminohexanoate cleavage protein [Lachnospiraceae bacterium]